MWIIIAAIVIIAFAIVIISTTSKLHGKDEEARENAEQDIQTMSDYEDINSRPPIPNPFDQLRKKD